LFLCHLNITSFLPASIFFTSIRRAEIKNIPNNLFFFL
jgi:hypothetical protein